MAMQRKWIQAATIAVDEETGAILVSGAGGGSVEIVGLKNAGGETVNPATKESVDAVAAALADPAQAGEAEAAAALILAALQSPAQAGEADAAAGSIASALGSPAQEDGAVAAVAERLLNGSDSAAKLLADVVAALASQATSAKQDTLLDNTRLDLLGVGGMTVDGGSKTLATLGVTVHASMKRLTLVVCDNEEAAQADRNIAFALGGAASAGSKMLQPGVYTFDVSKAVADTLQFVRNGSADVGVTVVQEG